MSANTDFLFQEKQHLGRDPINQSLRLLGALIFFMSYFFNQDNENGDLLLLAGSGIVVFSILLMFWLHFSTTVTQGSIILDGLWTTKRVKLDLGSIVLVEKVKFSSSIINYPAYNLHRRGSIRFYASGRHGVRLVDKDGLKYVIGTQRQNELYEAIKKQLGNK